jgi:hypothetical protein
VPVEVYLEEYEEKVFYKLRRSRENENKLSQSAYEAFIEVVSKK